MSDRGTRFSLVLALLSALLLVTSATASAQLQPGTVEVKRAVGTVEVQRQGQGAWSRIQAGARLSEQDQIRAMAGASADLLYPDGSTVLLAENSRLAMTSLAYNPATQGRNISSHLAVGKIKAEVKKAAVELVRARQANFNISTPAGIASVRGTVLFIAFNPATNQIFIAASPSPGQPPLSATVTFIVPSPTGGTPVTVTISGGQFTTKIGDGPPSAPQSLGTLPPAAVQSLGTAANPQTTGDPNLTAVVRVVSKTEMDQIMAAAPPPAVSGQPTGTPPSEQRPSGPSAPSGSDVSPTG